MTLVSSGIASSPLADAARNISHCWRCSHCKWVPSPRSHRFAHACPSIEYGGFHPYSGGGKVITAYAVAAGEADYSAPVVDSIFACTMCGACDTGCKINNGEIVEPLSVMYALRADAVSKGRGPTAHAALVDNMLEHGNGAGRARGERSLWAASLDLPDATREAVDVVLHVGCENAFDEAQWSELRAIVVLLQRARVKFGLLYDKEHASGAEAYDLGYQDSARRLAEATLAVLAGTRAPLVVTCSATSYNGFINIWPRLGIIAPFRVKHIADYVDELCSAGQLAISGSFTETVTYHDPCKLGRLGERFTPSDAEWTKVLQTVSAYDRPVDTLFGNGGVYEPPRRLLDRLNGLTLVEMERNRVSSYCCGAGGGALEASPAFAAQAAENRLAEAEATGASVLATACGGCRRHLARVAGARPTLRVMGVFELLAAAGA